MWSRNAANWKRTGEVRAAMSGQTSGRQKEWPQHDKWRRDGDRVRVRVRPVRPSGAWMGDRREADGRDEGKHGVRTMRR